MDRGGQEGDGGDMERRRGSEKLGLLVFKSFF